MTITLEWTLGDLVAERPGAARVLDRLGLDFCCHGEQTLGSACEEAGLDPASVAADLERESDGTGPPDWTGLGPVELVDHLVDTHHRYLRDELPWLDALAEKVLGVHGERHPELGQVRAIVALLGVDLPVHLDAEEEDLFPAVRALAAGTVPAAVLAQVQALADDHDDVGEQLAEMRRITGGFQPPEDCCASYRLLYERLAGLEADTHLHVHKENHALFPAVRRMAETVTAS
jgi:regulator of cell morphogenesis and NO signaling